MQGLRADFALRCPDMRCVFVNGADHSCWILFLSPLAAVAAAYLGNDGEGLVAKLHAREMLGPKEQAVFEECAVPVEATPMTIARLREWHGDLRSMAESNGTDTRQAVLDQAQVEVHHLLAQVFRQLRTDR
jgi:hypothetical protein